MFKVNDNYLSIKPFEDCCTVYVPKAPATAPKIDKAVSYESKFDYEKMVDWALENVNTFYIDVRKDLDLPSLGLEVREVKELLKNKMEEEDGALC